MGRMLGAFADDDELDRPDLNKCPDCDCFFASDTCPLCKKVCPEEMRAGNRKPVKPKKHKRRSGSGRVTFISWYHRWWFILLMLWAMPIVGIVLLISSPHDKWKKWLVVAIGVIWLFVSTFGIGGIISAITGIFDRPVDTSLSREEYVAKCDDVTAEQYYRSYTEYENEFVCIELKVVGKALYASQNNDDAYYICTPVDNNSYYVMIRDCQISDAKNLIAGDVITVYGQGDTDCYVYDKDEKYYEGPCLNMAYCVFPIED